MANCSPLGAPLEFVLGVILAGSTAMALGLLLSTVVRSSDRALVLLPLVLVGPIIL